MSDFAEWRILLFIRTMFHVFQADAQYYKYIIYLLNRFLGKKKKKLFTAEYDAKNQSENFVCSEYQTHHEWLIFL